MYMYFHNACQYCIDLSPLPVVVKSLELYDQHFGQSANAQSLHCVHLPTYSAVHTQRERERMLIFIAKGERKYKLVE